jgi:phospholipid/cholesterol/gamma-HCH transport system substrate-binding protein
MTRLRLSRLRKERLKLVVGGAAGALVIWMLLVASVTVQNGLPGNKGDELRLEFASVGNINRFDDVRVAGRRIGGVSSIKYSGGRAEVRVRLTEGLGGLRESTTARIRLAGLIGAEYVELVPGDTGPPLASGATIPMSRTSTSPDVFAALTAFDKRRVRDLRSLTRALGAGFAGRGEGANRALQTTPPLLEQADLLLRTLSSNRTALRRLIPAAASFVAAIEPVREEIAEGFDPGERSLRPFADNQGSVAALLYEMARVVQEIPVEMPKARPLLRETEGLSRAVTRLTAHAPGALREATLLLREAPRPLQATAPVLRTMRSAVPPTLQLVEAISPLVPPFGRSLELVLPGFRESGKRICDYDTAFAWIHSVPAFGQPADHELGADNLIRVLSGGDGFAGENQSSRFDESKPSKHDEDPPPCEAADQVVK